MMSFPSIGYQKLFHILISTGIAERMNTLGLKSRQKIPSEGSLVRPDGFKIICKHSFRGVMKTEIVNTSSNPQLDHSSFTP